MTVEIQFRPQHEQDMRDEERLLGRLESMRVRRPLSCDEQEERKQLLLNFERHRVNRNMANRLMEKSKDRQAHATSAFQN